MSRSRSPHTLRRSITVQGRGVHSNLPCKVTVHPAEQATGLRFLHSPSGTTLPVSPEFVGDISLATTLCKDGVRLGTIEHLLSALVGLEIEHALIEVDGTELPILDGSAAPWVKALSEAGTRALPGTRRFIKVLRPVEVQGNNKWMRISPHPGFRVRYTIDFDHPAIGRQVRELTFTPEKYLREVSSARTFCMERDIAFMQSRGLALGGGLDNAVVFGQDGPLNDALRFEDEAVRHKMLDLVGDFALLGAPLLGFVEAHAAGHALHVSMVKALLDDPSAWAWSDGLDLEPKAHKYFAHSHHIRPALA